MDIAYEGPKPAWLKDSGKSVFPGRLVLVQVKDFDANKRAR